LARTGVEGNASTLVRIGIARYLKRGNEVDTFSGVRVDAGPDRAIRENHRRLVVFQYRRQRAHRGLVTGDHGNESLHVVAVQVHVDAVVGDLAADQRKAHAVGAVQLSVRHAEAIGRVNQPDGQFILKDAGRDRRLDGLDLASDADVTLAVTQTARYRPDRVVDLVRVLAQRARGTYALYVAPRIGRHEAGLSRVGGTTFTGRRDDRGFTR
jgi:hypothetical protein